MSASTEDLLGTLLSALDAELPRAVELRHRLHAAPELAHAEERTAASVADALELPCETIVGTGRLASVGPEGSAAIALRAELDGLPLQERTEAPFSATGETMHACGHDVHMAALVALTRAAYRLGDELPVPLLAVFQPSEEAYPSGAEQLAALFAGASGSSSRRELRAVLGAHIHPELRWGEVALDPGVVNASSDSVEIVIEGSASHGAYPHLGRDPVLALAQVVVALHAQAARRIAPQHAATLNVGVLEGAGTENVIPPRARARASLRAHRPEDRETLRELVIEVTEGIAAAHGCRGACELIPGEPPLSNDPEIVERARARLARLGLAAAPEWRSCGSDDFAFFGDLAPLAMAFVGLDGAPSFSARPLHHPELLPPDEAVAAVARVQALLYVSALG